MVSGRDARASSRCSGSRRTKFGRRRLAATPCILFGQGTPVPLRDFLPSHTIDTAYERGWSKLSNGDLLAAAESNGLEFFITTDQNLRYQQNLSGRKIAILVLPTTRWPEIQQHVSEISGAVAAMMAGEFRELKW